MQHDRPLLSPRCTHTACLSSVMEIASYYTDSKYLSNNRVPHRLAVARWPGGGGAGGAIAPPAGLKEGAHQPPSKLHEMCLIKMIIYVVYSHNAGDEFINSERRRSKERRRDFTPVIHLLRNSTVT